jgi:hypothetical protein
MLRRGRYAAIDRPEGALRYCDMAMIVVLLAIAAGFVCQAVVWLAM